MDIEPNLIEMASPIGSLEMPEGLLQALTGSRGEAGITRLTDLPSVIVGSILSRVRNPFDIASAFKASRIFWGVARTAPFRLRLRPSRYQDGGGFVASGDDAVLLNRTGNDAQKSITWTVAALTGIRCVMRSTEELDLAGCPILDDDVAGVLGDLRYLECLVLDGCQKLTSSVAHALAVSVRSGPRVLSLQRCFRLGPAAAGILLAAAAAEGSRLQTILLSHLDRLDLRQEPLLLSSIVDGNCKEIEDVEVIKSIGSSSPGAGLRILALHNCGSLGYSELVAISETCPYLEVLTLGGSVDGLGLSRRDMSSQEQAMAASALVGATELLSRLRILEITFFTASILQAVRKQVSNRIYVWDFCDKDSVATAARVVASLKTPGQAVGGEEYFLGCPEDPPLACNALSLNEEDQSASETFLSHKRHGDLERVNNGGVTESCYRYQVFDKRWDCTAEDVAMALRAGTNCSGARKRTPLHVAAASGEATVVSNLLYIGAAAWGMKDNAGATALFLAAENGHAQVCDHLLRGGADVLASNRTGDTPLYIAALRGHSVVVEVMLLHCQEHGVNWQDAKVYGDGWTPLMAASVADRQEVGKMLLWGLRPTPRIVSLEEEVLTEPQIFVEHGSHIDPKYVNPNSENRSNSSSKLSANDSSIGGTLPRCAPHLLDAQNRYGQTALHIAARRGFLWFVSNLLHAGASLDIRDEYGLRAIDVARKQKRFIVERHLKEWEEEHKNVHDSSIPTTSKKQPGTRKKTAAASKSASRASVANNSVSSHKVLAWVRKNPSVAKSLTATPEAGSSAEGSDLELELPTLPDSPTTIIPSWMHSSPPLSPHFDQLSAITDECRNIVDVEGRGGVGDGPDLLGSEKSQTHDMVDDSQNYWRGRGIRQKTTSGDCSSSSSSENSK